MQEMKIFLLAGSGLGSELEYFLCVCDTDKFCLCIRASVFDIFNEFLS